MAVGTAVEWDSRYVADGNSGVAVVAPTVSEDAVSVFFSGIGRPRRSTLFPYTTLFRSIRTPPLPPCSPQVCGVPPLPRSEEHTSELQSQSNLVCRLLLETKKAPDPEDLAVALRRGVAVPRAEVLRLLPEARGQPLPDRS